jgi:16S rRNA (guanine966-N2)-methyltransferase
LRIISGTYKSRKIHTPSLSDPKGNRLRPTSDRAKETLFDILQSRVDFTGMVCLDLFAGTGSLGFECISRGADSALFVDRSRLSEELIGSTSRELGCQENVEFYRQDVSAFLSNNPDVYFDLIFADPPYDFPEYAEFIQKVLSRNFGVFVFESGKDEGVIDTGNRFEVIDKKVGFTFFKIFISI